MPVNLGFKLSFEDSPFLRKLNKVNGAIEDTAKTVNLFRNLVAIDLAIEAFQRLFVAIEHVGEKGAELIRLEKSLEQFLGNGDRAQRFLSDLDSVAAEFSLPVDELREGGKQLLAFGFGSDQAQDSLVRLKALSTGTGSSFKELADAFGKARTSGVQMEDINKFTERGVDLFSEFAKILQVDQNEVRKLVGQGKIGFEELELAIQGLTDEGGKFSGILEAFADTNLGRLQAGLSEVKAGIADLGAGLIEGLDLKDISENLGLDDIEIDFRDAGGAVGNFATEWIDWNAKIIRSIKTIITEFNPVLQSLLLGKSILEEIGVLESNDSEIKSLDIDKEKLALIEEINKASKEAAEGLSLIQDKILAQSGTIRASIEGLRKEIEATKAKGSEISLIGATDEQRLEILKEQLNGLINQAKGFGEAFNLDVSIDGGIDAQIEQFRNLNDQLNETFDSRAPNEFADELKKALDFLEKAAQVEFSTSLGSQGVDKIKEAIESFEEINIDIFPPETREALQTLIDLPKRGALAAKTDEVRAALEAAFSSVENLKIETESTNTQYGLMSGLIGNALEKLGQMKGVQEKLTKSADAFNEKADEANQAALDLIRLNRARLEGEAAFTAEKERQLAADLRAKGVAEELIRKQIESARILRKFQEEERRKREQEEELRNKFPGFDTSGVGDNAVDALLNGQVDNARAINNLIADLNESAIGATEKQKEAIAEVTAQLKEQLATQRELETEERKANRGRKGGRSVTFNQEETAARARDRRSAADLKQEIERERFFEERKRQRGQDTQKEREKIADLENDLEKKKTEGAKKRGENQKKRDAERKKFLDEAEKRRNPGGRILEEQQRKAQAQEEQAAKVARDKEAKARKERQEKDENIGTNVAKLVELVPLAEVRNEILTVIGETLIDRLPKEAL